MEEREPTYLDHNATTPVDPRVLEAMLPHFTQAYGNPASVDHVHGNKARQAVEDARAQVAAALGARDSEIVFTGGCTEANNIAILGSARARPDRRHFVTSAIEHPAVLEPMHRLREEGCEIDVIAVDQDGTVRVDELVSALRPDTNLVSVMGANNEVGTVQQIAAIGAACEERGILLHTDLAQVMAHRRVDVAAEHIHLASLSGHKAYGPKGVGALYVRSRSPRARVAPVTLGGGQERGLRPGTVNVPAVVGLGAALEIAGREAAADSVRLAAISGEFVRIVSASIPDLLLNGHPTQRLPGTISMSIPGVEPLALMHRLNTVASFSASSACATGKVETSHVLLAMFGDTARARQAFRVSPGRFTNSEDVKAFAHALIAAVGELRRFAA